jgi:5'-methylthioadenosine phosphorylase
MSANRTPPIAVIGGTGLYQLLDEAEPVQVETPYGAAAAWRGDAGGREVVFLPRHGESHTVPPHRINFRANIQALRELGCGSIIATNAVGSLEQALGPSTFVLPHDFLDLTRGRPRTFFDGENGIVKHVDVTRPYCVRLSDMVAAAAETAGLTVTGGAVYACMEGPRFETPAEIRALAGLGATLVGMTGLPECVLAREAGMCYASICIVTNYAAGISPSPLTHAEVEELMQRCSADVRRLILATIERETDAPDCPCRQPIR